MGQSRLSGGRRPLAAAQNKKPETGNSVGDRRKLYCITCKIETHHELKALHERDYSENVNRDDPGPELEYWEAYKYRFWICCGCDSATLEIAYTSIAMEQDWESQFYPKRVDLLPKRFLQLNRRLAAIYAEIILSFSNDARVLCTIGLRTLLEGICADKGLKGKDLFTKIDGLKTMLPENIVQGLHEFRFMGNIAAHELQAPKRSELRQAIEVMEDLLNFLYELEYKASRLRGSTYEPLLEDDISQLEDDFSQFEDDISQPEDDIPQPW